MRRTKEEAEQTRSEILGAAARVFSENGIERTTLEGIAKVAGVTRGAIYWHFKNKLEIFDELYEQLHKPFLDLIVEELEKDHPEPLQQLEELCIKVFLDLDKDEEKCRLLRFFLFKCSYSGELAEYLDRHNQKQLEKQKIFIRYFEKAKIKGKLPQDADPLLLTLAVSAYLKGLLHNYLENPEGFDLTTNAPKLIPFFFESLK